jgi:hypothetical protein
MLWGMFVLPFRLMRGVKRLDRLTAALPLKTYANYPFGVCVNDQFDRFSAPIEWRFTANEVKALLVNGGFTETVVLENHGWVGSGRRPAFALPTPSPSESVSDD